MDKLIMYNTIMTMAAGVGLVGFALLARQLWRRDRVASEGWSMLFAINGIILTVLGIIMSTTWPFRLPGTYDANILMGEPSIAFGLLLLAGAFYLWRRADVFVAIGSSDKKVSNLATVELIRVAKPISLFVFGVGMIMTACAIAWVRYRLGGAPPAEPISGLLSNYPWLEAIFLGVLWGIVAIGALLFPFALRSHGRTIASIIFVCWLVAGVAFMVFGMLNYYSHIGLTTNLTTNTHYRY